MFQGQRELQILDSSGAAEERNMVTGQALQGTDCELEPHPNSTLMDVQCWAHDKVKGPV